MIGKAILVILWFPLTLLLLIINLSLLVATTQPGSAVNAMALPDASGRRVTGAAVGTAQVLGTEIIAGDARGLLLENYLTRHGSPLAPFADTLVRQADANGLDFRLLVAIAMCESNLGKKLPSHDSFNPFGIAVYTDSLKGKKFQNWEHAIGWVSNYIKSQYYDRGITNLHDIGTIWAPPTEAANSGWSSCVSHFQQSIL